MQKVDAAERMLQWYDRHHRELPWRVTPSMARRGVKPDPYRIWLSEVMLQQTTVQAVKAYFEKFTTLWPTVNDLAAASDDDVMKAWAGLGYYARARNLKKCAETIAKHYDGIFPDSQGGLAALPGIGDYTSAAIAAIAFDRPAAVMDGNVERVIARFFAIDAPLPGSKPEMKARVVELTPLARPGDFAQSMMDLGATICTPKRPACVLCPLKEDCEGLKTGEPELYPVKAAKKAKPVRVGAAFVAIDRDGHVLLHRRPASGLLGGMRVLPSTDWTARQDGETGPDSAPFLANWLPRGTVSHVFTHFELRLSVYLAAIGDRPDVHGFWEPVQNIDEVGLPTVMKKALVAALPDKLND